MNNIMELRLKEAIMKKKAPKHDDVKEDKKLIKKMVKKKCVK